MLHWVNEYKLSCFEPQRKLQVLVDIWWSVEREQDPGTPWYNITVIQLGRG